MHHSLTVCTSKAEGDSDVESHVDIEGQLALPLPGLFILCFASPLFKKKRKKHLQFNKLVVSVYIVLHMCRTF